MSDPSRRAIRKRARRMFPAALRSLAARTLLFCIALLAVGLFTKPWKWEWLRIDEAASIAEDFLTKQNSDADEYSLIKVAEYREGGVWSALLDERRFALDPSVGYLFHFFKEGKLDGWMVGVSPAGQIYRVRRDIPDDEPGLNLNRDDAYNLVLQKLSTDLTLPANDLVYESDTLVVQPQRSDWTFRFQFPPADIDSLESDQNSTQLMVTLSGNCISNLSIQTVTATPAMLAGKMPIPPETEHHDRSRLLGFALIIFGVFQALMHHRTPLAYKAAGIAGGVIFTLVVAQKALTFYHAAILIPYDVPVRGFLARIALGAVVEALQVAIIMGLIVATGEAISRDLLPNVTTLTRVAPSQRGWVGAWVQAGRYALPLAAVILIFESLAARYIYPIGFAAQALPVISGTLTSSYPSVALPILSSVQVLWEESLYRLWLVPLLLFWVRGPLTAIAVGALTATYFAGYDPSQWLTLSSGTYFAWSILAGWLTFRVGILAAIMFHFLILGGYTAIALVWSGYGLVAGVTFISLMVLMLIFIGIKGEKLTREAFTFESADPEAA